MSKEYQDDIVDNQRMLLYSLMAYLIREGYIENRKPIGVLQKAFLQKAGVLDKINADKIEDMSDLFEEAFEKILKQTDKDVLDKMLEVFFKETSESIDD